MKHSEEPSWDELQREHRLECGTETAAGMSWGSEAGISSSASSPERNPVCDFPAWTKGILWPGTGVLLTWAKLCAGKCPMSGEKLRHLFPGVLCPSSQVSHVPVPRCPVSLFPGVPYPHFQVSHVPIPRCPVSPFPGVPCPCSQHVSSEELSRPGK